VLPIVLYGAGAARPAASSLCRPASHAGGSLVAPNLRVVKTIVGLGTCPRGLRVTTRGPGGRLWATDTFNGLWSSSDEAKTWQLTYTASSYHNVERVLQVRSGRVLIVVAAYNGRRYVLRSTNSSGTHFGRPVFAFPFNSSIDGPDTAPRLLGSQSWVQAPSGAIYMGEYGFALNPITLWRSTNDGKSFGVASTWSGADVRHIHSVYINPFSPKELWVAIGDTGNQPRIGYSTDGGATFTYVSHAIYPQSRAVGLMFAKDGVMWATDTPEVPAGLFRWDRASGTVSQLLGGLNGPFYYTVQFGNAYAQFSTVSTRENDGYIGDNYIHAVTSAGGVKWSTAQTPWMRAPDQPHQKATILGITAPDKKGRFFVSFYALAGASAASGETTSVELQLIPGG
jgi:hypothetical protein